MVKKDNKIIVFLIPPQKDVNGGIISIFSLAEESRKLTDVHDSTVFVSTFPGYSSYIKNDLFNNNEVIYDFESLLKKYQNGLDSLLIHIPEYACNEIYYALIKHKRFLKNIKDLHINILNQNIKLLPSPLTIFKFYSFTKNITLTTAHKSYCTQAFADKYQVPTHLMSVHIDKDNYHKKNFADKKDLIVISPDKNKDKDIIVQKIKKELPQYQIIQISNMTFEEYKSHITNAKFIITFGEGFDGYFIEGIYSETVSFAVYNNDFFPNNEYLKLENIYISYEQMLKNIVDQISSINYKKYYSILGKSESLLKKIYKNKFYLANIVSFYKKDYSFIPENNKINEYRTLLSTLYDKEDLESIKQKYELVHEKEKLESIIHTQYNEIEALNTLLNERTITLDNIYKSKSWKITDPLRRINKKSK